MKRLCLIICAAVMAASLVAVMGCGGNGGSGASPSEVAEQFLKAQFDKDVDTAHELLSSQDKQQIPKEDLEKMAAMMPEGYEYSFEVTGENISGDTATVNVSITAIIPESEEPQTSDQSLNLVKEGGEWKISVLANV